jgi:hypothetical protein
MRHYDEIARLERDGFEIIVDKTWEDISLSHCFDDECYDIAEMEAKVNNYDLDWFMLRVRVMLDGHELGSHYLGGCLYDWNKVNDVLTDGTAEDCIYEAMNEAKAEVKRLKEKLNALVVE